jgi:hypothetical protein
MAFDGNEGTMITLDEGATLTRNYRTTYPRKSLGAFFGKERLLELLNQPECMGIRIYLGEENSDFQMVLVGADANQDDLLDLILDRGKGFPPYNSNSNALNS